VLDLSGRPGLELGVSFTRERVGTFDVDLIREFFQGFANHALVTLHIDNIKGINSHHQAETVFKALVEHSVWRLQKMNANQIRYLQQRAHLIRFFFRKR
jgi:imidazoleglycerol phosphate dehydratase HisB